MDINSISRYSVYYVCIRIPDDTFKGFCSLNLRHAKRGWADGENFVNVEINEEGLAYGRDECGGIKHVGRSPKRAYIRV